MRGPTVGIFCDFDGTISQRDLITTIGLEFGGTEARETIDKVQRRELSVREGVEGMFSAIPSHRMDEIVEFARRRTVVREGFYPFVDKVLDNGWLFAVVSGGFDFFVEPVIERYKSKIEVFCNHLNTTGEFLKVEWAVTCDSECDGNCGLCKPSVLRQFRERVSFEVVVGDGVTDLKAARLADYVFARDRLAQACEAEGIPYTSFETFCDMALQIEEHSQSQRGQRG